MLELLTVEHDNNDVQYDDADIRRHATEIHELCPFVDSPFVDSNGSHGLLAVLIRDIHVSFAVFGYQSGPASVDGKIVDGVKWKHVFHGSGPAGNLRELRHSYWGEADNAGYIFYPSASVIAAAFERLKTWFDCEV